MSMDQTELLQRAYAMEVEAAERYGELARQMRNVNNRDVADIFDKLAEVEGNHAAEIHSHLDAIGATPEPELDYAWQSPEGPETVAFEAVHYLMTEEQALQLALHNEKRAAAYFKALCSLDLDAETQVLAENFAEEEAAHVRLVEDLLRKAAPTSLDWAEDPDHAHAT
jgi:rubrerythrin